MFVPEVFRRNCRFIIALAEHRLFLATKIRLQPPLTSQITSKQFYLKFVLDLCYYALNYFDNTDLNETKYDSKGSQLAE